MKGGNKLFLFAGIGLALVAVLLGITMTSGGNEDADGENIAAAQQDTDPAKLSVVRLLVDVEPHQIIRPEMVEVVEVDSKLAPADAITDPSAVVSQAYMISAVKGDVLRSAFVEPPGLASSIDPGMRAISLKVDAQGSMSGLVVPGDYIDVTFKARVDLRKIINFVGVELDEDGGPYKISGGSDGDDAAAGNDDDEDSSGLTLGGEETPVAEYPFQGQEGGEFIATDAGQNLEPVAKLLIQDVKVIRVVLPGVQYDEQGQQVAMTEDSNSPTKEEFGQLIIQVSPQQAEALTFMQDPNHSYSITVRAKDDHEVVETSGITFEILMSDGTWSMPWPVPIIPDDVLEDRAAEDSATPIAEELPDEDVEEATPVAEDTE